MGIQLVFESRRRWSGAVWAGVLCLLAGSPTVAQESDPDALRWNWEPGLRLAASSDQELVVTSQVEKRQRKVVNQIHLEMAWSVDSVEQGVATILQTLTRVRLETDDPAGVGSLVVDTATPGEGLTRFGTGLWEELQPLVGMTFEVQMDERGRVVAVELPEEALETLRNMSGGMSLRALFSPDGLRELYGQSLLELPAEAMAEEGGWEIAGEVATPLGLLTRTRQFQLVDSPDAATQKIESTTLVELPVAGEGGVEIKGYSADAEYLWDRAAGRLVAATFESRIQAVRPYKDREIVTRIEASGRFELKPLAAASDDETGEREPGDG